MSSTPVADCATPSSPATEWRADRYAASARFVSDLGAPVLALLDPRPGECILDLGCGDGVVTERILAAGAAVVAVDSAPDMVSAARERGIDARVIDGHDLPFDGRFGAVFSNAALHWMTRPDAVIAGVRRALRPGGRFVGEFGGFGNVAAATVALTAALGRRGIDARPLNPWYFPTADEYAARLGGGGFDVIEMALIPRPTRLDAGAGAWLEMFFQAFLKAVPVEERQALVEEVAALLAPSLRTPLGVWYADYVRLRFAAVRR